ncbi:MAG: RNA polymerase sigma factor [Bacteroidia bacterium]|nr:RNA polymerase sigma factor [Bacteroidia bacterium]
MKKEKEQLENEFLRLVNEHLGIIHKVCRMYQKGTDEQEDLFQEILLQLWRSFPSFKSESKFSTWMYRIALNTAITGIRKDRRNPEISQLTKDTDFAVSENHDLEKIERKELLMTAIESLSKVEKALVVLYMEGYSYEEMAELVGISLSNTGVKINRIKKKLKQILTPHLT